MGPYHRWFCPDTLGRYPRLPQTPTKKKNPSENCWWRVRGIFQGYVGEILDTSYRNNSIHMGELTPLTHLYIRRLKKRGPHVTPLEEPSVPGPTLQLAASTDHPHPGATLYSSFSTKNGHPFFAHHQAQPSLTGWVCNRTILGTYSHIAILRPSLDAQAKNTSSPS